MNFFANLILEQTLSPELRYEFDERVAIILTDHPPEKQEALKRDARQVAWNQVVDRHSTIQNIAELRPKQPEV